MFGLGLQELIIILFFGFPIALSIWGIKKKLTAIGVVDFIIAFVGFIWVNGHSPYSANSNIGWYLNETVYYIMLAYLIVIGGLGLTIILDYFRGRAVK